MPRESDHSATGLENDNTGGLMTGFLAEEEEFDRRALWRVGSWGAASVGAVIVALLANQFSSGLRREQVAASDLVRQSQQIQSIAKESQLEARRLASAIDTLNSDRDRLYSRVTVLEQGLDSMTGAIARQSAAAPAPAASTSAAPIETPVATQTQTPPPTVSPVTTTATTTAEKPRVETTAPPPAPATVASVGQGTSQSPPQTTSQASSQDKSNAPAPVPVPVPATPFVTAKSMLAPPDSTATKLIEPEKPAKLPTAPPKADTVATVARTDDAEPDEAEAAPSKVAVQRTEFGVDVGGANSVGGLRALWRGLLKSRSNAALTSLRPIIVIKENSTGLGMQLRLVAGPLTDAAAAAKICAGLTENQRPCETTVFDGQRLAMNDPADAVTKPNMAKPEPAKPDASPPVAAKPVAAKPVYRRRISAKRAANDEAAKKPDPPSTFSSLFSRH
jgi:hypothetical protein